MVERRAVLNYSTAGARGATSDVVSLAQALERQERNAARLAPVLQKTSAAGGVLGSVSQSATAKIASLTNQIGPLGAGLGAVSRYAPQAAQGLIQYAAGAERAAMMSRMLNTAVIGGAAAFTAGSVAILAYADDVIRAGDTYETLRAKIRIYTQGAVEAAEVERDLYANARNTRSEVEGQVTLYSRLAPAVRDWGRSQQEALRIVELTSKAMAIQGGDVREQLASTIQFSQGIGSGVLRGDEFRTLREAAPQLVRYLAQNIEVGGKIGVAFSQMKTLADEGLLSTDNILAAMLRAGPQIEKDFANAPIKAQQGWTLLTDKVIQTTGQVMALTGAQRGVFDWLVKMTDQVDAFRQKMIMDPGSFDEVKAAAAFIGDVAGGIGDLGGAAVENFDLLVTAGQAIIALKLGEVFAGWFAAAANGSRKALGDLQAFRAAAAFNAGAVVNPTMAGAAVGLRNDAAAMAIRQAELEAQAGDKAARATAARTAAEGALARAQDAREVEVNALAAAELRLAAANERTRQSMASSAAAGAAQGLSQAGLGPAGAYYAAKARADANKVLVETGKQVVDTEQKMQVAAAATAARHAAEAEATALVTAANRAEAQAKSASTAATNAKAAASARNAVAQEAESAVTRKVTGSMILKNAAAKTALGLYNLLGGGIGIATLALGALFLAVMKAEQAYRAQVEAQREAMVISDRLAGITQALTAATWAQVPALMAEAEQLRDSAAAAREKAAADLEVARARRQRLEAEASAGNEFSLGLLGFAQRDERDRASNLAAAKSDEWRNQRESDRQRVVALVVEARDVQRQLGSGKDAAGRELSASQRAALEARRGALFTQGQGLVDQYDREVREQEGAIARATGATKQSYVKGLKVWADLFDAAAELVSAADTPAAAAITAPGKTGKTTVPAPVNRAFDELTRQQYLPKEGLDRFSLVKGSIVDGTTKGPFAARSEDEAKAAADYVKQIEAINAATAAQIRKTGESREALRQAASARLAWAVQTSQASQAEDRWADLLATSSGESRAVVKAEREINDLRAQGAKITEDAARAYVAFVEAREKARQTARDVDFAGGVARTSAEQVLAGSITPTDHRGVTDVEAAVRQVESRRADIVKQTQADLIAELKRLNERGEIDQVEYDRRLRDAEKLARVAAEIEVQERILEIRKQSADESARYQQQKAEETADRVIGGLRDIARGADPKEVGKRFMDDMLQSIMDELIWSPLRKIIIDWLRGMGKEASAGGGGGWLETAANGFLNIAGAWAGGAGGGGGGPSGHMGGNAGGGASNMPKFADGGLFRGRPGKDQNLVRLSDKEFVTNPRATAMWLPLLEYINSGAAPPGYADGGLVGGGSSIPRLVGQGAGSQPIQYVEGDLIINDHAGVAIEERRDPGGARTLDLKSRLGDPLIKAAGADGSMMRALKSSPRPTKRG